MAPFERDGEVVARWPFTLLSSKVSKPRAKPHFLETNEWLTKAPVR